MFCFVDMQFSKDIDMVSDAQRIKKVKTLVDNGYTHRILLSHDMHSKHRLVSQFVSDVSNDVFTHGVHWKLD